MSGGRPRLLWVDLKPPTPRHDTASLRVVQLLAALGRQGWAVDFAAMFPAPQAADPADLAACGARALPCADEASILAHVAREGRHYRGSRRSPCFFSLSSSRALA